MTLTMLYENGIMEVQNVMQLQKSEQTKLGTRATKKPHPNIDKRSFVF